MKPMTNPLSPAAQAVLDAVTAELDWDARYHSHAAAAAALKAAADQVVPPTPFDRQYTTQERWEARDYTRLQLLAIAAELEGAK